MTDQDFITEIKALQDAGMSTTAAKKYLERKGRLQKEPRPFQRTATIFSTGGPDFKRLAGNNSED